MNSTSAARARVVERATNATSAAYARVVERAANTTSAAHARVVTEKSYLLTRGAYFDRLAIRCRGEWFVARKWRARC